MKIFIGVDPGSKGAIVAINEDRNLIMCEDMPFIEGQISMKKINEIFNKFDPENSFAAIEVAKAMKQDNRQSVASMLKYGIGLGILKMGLYVNNISCTEVQSNTWMSILGVYGKTSGKYNGDKIAAKTIPTLHKFIYEKNSKAENGVKIYDGRADAGLIAEWRLRKYLLNIANKTV